MANEGADSEIPPNATVYVRNINERVKIPAVIEALRELFSGFGEIQEIIAKKSLRRKGQAFIVFDDIESAQTAIDDLNGFEIFGKQLALDFAKTRSDATVLNEDGEEALEEHKKTRLAEKERKNAEYAAQAAEAKSKKRGLDEEETNGRPNKFVKQSTATMRDVPDEYLPPNPTLTIRDLPGDMANQKELETSMHQELMAAFSGLRGFKDLRLVASRNIAFVEYDTAELAAVAKQANSSLSVAGGISVKVNFRRG